MYKRQELDRYDVMNVYGELQEGALSPEGTLVNLKAVLTYQEDETRQALYELSLIHIYPCSPATSVPRPSSRAGSRK